MSQNSALLQVEGLGHRFGGLVAVQDVSFSVVAGEVVGLIGPNGAGKTTVFNMVAGLMPPSQGQIMFQGRDCTPLASHDMARLGVARTFQITSLFPQLSVLDNIRTGRYVRQQHGWLAALMRSSAWRREESQVEATAREILDFVDLGHRSDMLAHALPYGEQRKLEIAIALASGPSLLLLDEPAAGMNPDEGAKLVQMIQRIRERGVTVLLVEHHMKVVMGVCDRVIVLDSGRKIAEGRPAEVVNNPEVIRVYLGREKVHAPAA